MHLKRRSKSSTQFQLTINFDLDEIDQHHLTAEVKNKIISAYDAAENSKRKKKVRS